MRWYGCAQRPSPQGLYDGQHEHDACGVAFVATLSGQASNDIVVKALTALRNLDHRGASGAEPDSGDGAGILLQVPDAFLRAVSGLELPPRQLRRRHRVPAAGHRRGGQGAHADRGHRRGGGPARDRLARAAGQPRILGRTAAACMPTFAQLFVAAAGAPVLGVRLDRRPFCLRKRAEHETGVYFPTLSSRTLGYKGMLTTEQLEGFYPDLLDERIASALAVVHSRFSTNTFPSWPLAHPYRFIAHNGEINTVRGNRNWMRAREALLRSDLFAAPRSSDERGDLERLFPICDFSGSDSASFDEVLELLHLGGRSLPHSC
jgi:glutamate synthase (NADPH/NADH) large chain